MNLPYGITRRIGYVVCSVIPMFSVFIFMLLGLNLIGAYLFSFIAAIILPLMVSEITGKHPFIQLLTKGLILVVDVNSTGIAGLYLAKAINQDKDKINLEIDFGDRKEIRSYDRNLIKRFKIPVRAFLQFAMRKNTEGVVYETLEMKVPKSRFEEYVFGNQWFTMLFYNSETGMCLPKPQISEIEKALMVEMINMDLLRETRNLNKTMRDFMRYTFDVIMNRIRGLLQSSGFKWITILIVIMIIILVVMMFAPGIQEALTNTAGNLPGFQIPANTGIQNIPNAGG